MSAERARREHKENRRKRGTPVDIRAAMNALVHDLGIGPTLAQYDVITSWPGVVGEQVARVTVAQRIDRGILYVGVSSAAWRAELSMKRLEIIDKLNAKAGTHVVNDIRFR